MFLRKELIKVGLDAADEEDALRQMSAEFVALGVAKDSFPEALLERERVYPTGLPAIAFDIAIPHCASENVNETSMGVAVLAHPVEFLQMGSPTSAASSTTSVTPRRDRSTTPLSQKSPRMNEKPGSSARSAREEPWP